MSKILGEFISGDKRPQNHRRFKALHSEEKACGSAVNAVIVRNTQYDVVNLGQ